MSIYKKLREAARKIKRSNLKVKVVPNPYKGSSNPQVQATGEEGSSQEDPSEDHLDKMAKEYEQNKK